MVTEVQFTNGLRPRNRRFACVGGCTSLPGRLVDIFWPRSLAAALNQTARRKRYTRLRTRPSINDRRHLICNCLEAAPVSVSKRCQKYTNRNPCQIHEAVSNHWVRLLSARHKWIPLRLLPRCWASSRLRFVPASPKEQRSSTLHHTQYNPPQIQIP